MVRLFILDNQIGVSLCHVVILICVYLVTGDVEHLFMWLSSEYFWSNECQNILSILKLSCYSYIVFWEFKYCQSGGEQWGRGLVFCYLMILTGISLVINEVEYFYRSLLAFWTTHLGKCLFIYFALLFYWISSLLMICMSSLYVMDTSLLSVNTYLLPFGSSLFIYFWLCPLACGSSPG